MRKIFTLLLLAVVTHAAMAQGSYTQLYTASRTTEGELPFDENLAPFYHGVASGDPLEDRVVIWTRVTPENEEQQMEVTYRMATDLTFGDVVAQGTFVTDADRDYTVKVDVTGLQPNTTYYYFFTANGASSIIGRTKTTPAAAEADKLRFAVVSCSNYQAGYFNGYKQIAQIKDLDAVVHLGDYIYEYGAGPGTYGYSDSVNRPNVPDEEIIELMDYRTRYSLYRLDPDLRAAHQQHPFIPVWDDHESANDAYKDGAENHNEGEGDWEDRKSVSKQVYYEWMPIRENENDVLYRTISYGNLADLIMLDTRLEAREEQIFDITSPLLYAPDRTLLGQEQKAWFVEQLKNSDAKWKVIGNQVIFSEFHVGWAANPALGQTPEALESLFLDIWDGYPVERNAIIDSIAVNNIDNVVILTGDFHSSFAYDVAKFPSVFSLSDPLYDASLYGGLPAYDPATQAGSFAVEFATPSVTSANFDENLIADAGSYELAQVLTAQLEFQINNPLPDTIPQIGGLAPNPHMKYVDLDRHGYFILTLNADSAQADFFYTPIYSPSEDQTYGAGFFTTDEANKLTQATAAAAGKANASDLAPDAPFVLTANNDKPREVVVFSVYPNPLNELNFIQYGLKKSGKVRITLTDLQGREIAELLNTKQYAGTYFMEFSRPQAASTGTYLIRFQTETSVHVHKVIIR